MAKHKIIFACIGNSFRSQIAEGFARHHKPESLDVDIVSAGTRPADRVNPLAIQAMVEKGIDISSHHPKMFTLDMLKGATHFISMGCDVLESCPFPLVKGELVVEDWDLEDTAGKGIEFVRKARDEIEGKVISLLRSIAGKK